LSEVAHECTFKKKLMTKYKFEEKLLEAAISGSENFYAVIARNTSLLTRSNIASLGNYNNIRGKFARRKK
jgi:hypothetical protein